MVAGDYSKSIPITDVMVVAAHRVTRSNDETMSDEFENLEFSRDAQCRKFGRIIFLNKKVEASREATITSGRAMRILNPTHNGPERVILGHTSSKAQNQGCSNTANIDGPGNIVENLEASTDTQRTTEGLELGIMEERNEEEMIRCIEEMEERDAVLYQGNVQKAGNGIDEVGNGHS
ncbi:hypothetical protein Ancab_022154 [Ancistrocladus abbreviatus]